MNNEGILLCWGDVDMWEHASLSVPVSLSPFWNKNHTFNVQGAQSLIHPHTHIPTFSINLVIWVAVILKCLKHINNMPFLKSSVCTRSTCTASRKEPYACTLSPTLTKSLVLLLWVFFSAFSLMKHTHIWEGQCGRINALWTYIVRFFSYCEHFSIYSQWLSKCLMILFSNFWSHPKKLRQVVC